MSPNQFEVTTPVESLGVMESVGLAMYEAEYMFPVYSQEDTKKLKELDDAASQAYSSGGDWKKLEELKDLISPERYDSLGVARGAASPSLGIF